MMECSFADGVKIHRVFAEFIADEGDLGLLMAKLRQALRENTTEHPLLIEFWEYKTPQST